MRAHVVERPGPPEVIQLRTLADPEPRPGWVHVRVRAFGLNRSEVFSRQGHSGNAVSFPRVLGIECVGEVLACPGGDLASGTTVACAMGRMGRAYDGGYAEQTLVPRSNVFPLRTSLAWDVLGALPETYLTAWGVVTETLRVQRGQSVLVRGGTSSVGLAAICLLRDLGCRVLATTRQERKRGVLLEAGADDVLIDSGAVAPAVRAAVRRGVDAVVELVGSCASLADSFACCRPGGTLGHVGYLGNDWSWEPPAGDEGRRFLHYSSETLHEATATPALRAIVERVEAGRLRANIDRVLAFEQVVDGHRVMEASEAAGKLLVRTDG